MKASNIFRGVLTVVIFCLFIIGIWRFTFVGDAFRPIDTDSFFGQLIGLICALIPFLFIIGVPVIVVLVIWGLWYLAKNISKLI